MRYTLPFSFAKYFWDTKVSDINTNKHSIYIAERLLEYGDLNALEWLEGNYGREFLKGIILRSRKLSKKSANFYSHYYNIDSNNILCLQEDFQDRHKRIWNR